MAGKNSVRIPVSLELQADDVVNDYKNAINKNSNIKELQSQFKHLLDMQKQYIENAKSASDPIAKALNLQGVKAYSEMLSRIQSQITKIDKTKLSDFAIPRFQFNDKEIINNVKNIDKLIDTVVKDIDKINEMESKSNVGNMFKNIGSDSIKKYYKEQREISEQSIRSQIKNNNLSIESINELLNVLQQYEVFNKRIAKKNGAISTNISDILPKDLLKNEKFLETISLDDLQIKWQKITTPNIVENVRSAIIGNLSSRAMNKPLYIPTKGLVMDSDVANDFGTYQNKIDTAKEHLRALSAEFNKVNEFRLNLSDLNFAKDNDKVKNYLDLMFQIKSTMNEIATLSSVIGVNEKDLFKRAQTGLVLEDAVLPNGEMVLGFNSLFDDLLSKENKSVLSKYYSNISTSISEIYTKSMGDITNNSLSQLQAKLQQIDQMISMVSNSSVINDTTISTELDEIVGKENSLNLVLSQRQKIMSELEKSGYKFNDKEIKTNTAIAAMFEAEQIHKGITPIFGQTNNSNSNTSTVKSNNTENNDENVITEIKSTIDSLNKRVCDLEIKTSKIDTSSTNKDTDKVLTQIKTLSNKISELETKGTQANNNDIETVTADVIKLKEQLNELSKSIPSETYSKIQQQIQPLSEIIQKLGNLDGVASLKDMFEQVNKQIVTINQNLSVMEGKINGIGKNPANVVVPNTNINNTDKTSVQNEKDTINNQSIDYYSKLIERVKAYNELEAKHTDNNLEEKAYYDDRIKRLQTLKQLQAEIRDIISSGNLSNDERIKNIQINDHNKSTSIIEKSSLEVDFDKRIGDLKEQQKVAIQNLSNEVNNQKKRLKEITKNEQVSESNSEKLFEIIQSLEAALQIIEHNESLNSAQKKKSELTEILNRAKAVTVKSNPVKKASAKVGTRDTSVPKSNYLKDHIQANTTPDVSNTNKLQSQIKSLEKQKNDHQKSIENLTREINKLKSNSDTTKNQNKISGLQTDIANLKKEITSRDNEILYLQKQIEAIAQNANPITDTLNLNPSSNKKDESVSTKTSKRKPQNTITNTNQSKQEITAIHDVDAAVKDLTQRFNEKTQAIKVEAETMKTAADSEVADLQRISDKVTELKNGFTSAAPAGKIIMPDNSEISVPQKITSTNSGSALGSEIAAVGKLKTAFEDAGKAVDAKTTAITTEQTTMANAATTEVADIQKIIDALETLRNKIASLPKINVAGELNANTPVSITFNYNEDQIKVIREKVNAELNGNNAVPISFIPDVTSLKNQIASELKNIPVTFNSNKQVLNVTNIKVDTKTIEALKNNISNSLTELKIQSFSITDNAKTKLINELSGMLNNIGLAFDTSKLQQNISNAIQAAQAMAQNNQGNNSQNSNNQNNNATGNNQNANDALKRQIESYDKLKNKISEVEKQINKLKTYNYNKEFKDDFNSILGSISALGNVDTNNQSALTDWIKKSGAILKNWTKIEQRVKDAANYRATTSARTNYEDIVNKNATQKARNSYAVKKFEQVRDQYTSIKNDRGTLTDEQLNVIEQKYKEVYSLILKTGRVQNEFTAENLSKIDQEQQKFSEMIRMFQSANNGTGIFKIDTGRINNEIQKIENTMLNNNDANLNSSINSVRNLLNQYNQMSANVGKMNYSELEKYAQLISQIKTQVDNIKVSSNAIQNSLRNDNSVNKAAAKMDDLIVKMRQFAAQNSRINSDQAMKSQFAEMLRQAETLPKTAANWQMMTRQFNAFKAAVTSKGLTGRSVGDELRYIMEKIGLKAILGNQIYRIIGYLRQMVTVVKEIDSGMTDLKRVSQETETTYAKFLDASVEKAHALGSAMSNVIDATSKFSRLGYNLSEATALAENAIMYSNVGWLDIDTATQDLTSTMKAFSISAEDSIKIVDTFDIIGNRFAVTAANLGEGLRESASALATANNSMEESAAMITAITEITQDALSAGELRCPKMW